MCLCVGASKTSNPGRKYHQSSACGESGNRGDEGFSTAAKKNKSNVTGNKSFQTDRVWRDSLWFTECVKRFVNILSLKFEN